MTPLKCTRNGMFHVDYGVPLLASKSTDYRTSTGQNHALIPTIPQYFDCRVKTAIKPELLRKDVALRNERKSTYSKEYSEKYIGEGIVRNDQAASCGRVDYIRTAEEKIFRDPPAPRPSSLSETKRSYGFHCWQPHRDQAFNFKCQLPEAYKAVQPSINPGEKGYYKLLDMYLSENKSKYVPYTQEHMKKAQEDLVTFYNASGQYKGLKDEIPLKLHGRKNMYDKSVFRIEYPNRFLSKAPKKVPHSGSTSEYKTNYVEPMCSDFYPYLQENGVHFPESLCRSGPWQDLCPPAMYCSENCHIGTGWPIRAVVNVNAD